MLTILYIFFYYKALVLYWPIIHWALDSVTLSHRIYSCAPILRLGPQFPCLIRTENVPNVLFLLMHVPLNIGLFNLWNSIVFFEAALCSCYLHNVLQVFKSQVKVENQATFLLSPTRESHASLLLTSHYWKWLLQSLTHPAWRKREFGSEYSEMKNTP